MEFQISIDQFEGPLDLMLHLIKTNKLDLFDLDLAQLADQYIQYLHTMETMHLEIASEYMSELASLIEYKSKKLLPREKVEVQENYEEDQRERLVKRLIEYQKYKDISEQLKIRYEHRMRQLGRDPASIIDSFKKSKEDSPLAHQSIYALSKAFESALKKFALLQPYETAIQIKEISIEERSEQLWQTMHFDQTYSFAGLCQDCTTLHMVIVTFLSILDLIHQKRIQYQVDDRHTIFVRKREDYAGN